MHAWILRRVACGLWLAARWRSVEASPKKQEAEARRLVRCRRHPRRALQAFYVEAFAFYFALGELDELLNPAAARFGFGVGGQRVERGFIFPDGGQAEDMGIFLGAHQSEADKPRDVVAGLGAVVGKQ